MLEAGEIGVSETTFLLYMLLSMMQSDIKQVQLLNTGSGRRNWLRTGTGTVTGTGTEKVTYRALGSRRSQKYVNQNYF